MRDAIPLDPAPPVDKWGIRIGHQPPMPVSPPDLRIRVARRRMEHCQTAIRAVRRVAAICPTATLDPAIRHLEIIKANNRIAWAYAMRDALDPK